MEIVVPGIDHRDVVGFHLDAGKESGVGFLAIPSEFEDWTAPFAFVLDGGVLEIPDVELADTAVCSN